MNIASSDLRRDSREPLKWAFCPELRLPLPTSQSCCLTPERPPLRPDPSIYSQERLFALGQPLSWDSPDITTNLAGGIDENVVVSVENLSADSGAAGVDVRVDISAFGIGLPRKPLGFKRIDLGKAGAAASRVNVPFFVSPSDRDGERLCAVFVEIQHSSDRDSSNNRGEQAWSASRAVAGAQASFSFPIANRLVGTQSFSLAVLESAWSATLSATAVTLLPGQSMNVNLTVAVPAGFAGNRAFNVVARQSDGGLYGGVFHRFDV